MRGVKCGTFFSLSLRERVGVRGAARTLPLTLTLSPKGRGDRLCAVLNSARSSPSPLRERAGVRGAARTLPPHPNPLPDGERGPIVRGAEYGTFFSLSLRERAGVRGAARKVLQLNSAKPMTPATGYTDDVDHRARGRLTHSPPPDPVSSPATDPPAGGRRPDHG